MNTQGNRTVGCGGCALSRRQFFATGCAACAAGGSGLLSLEVRAAPGAPAAAVRPKVRLIFSHLPATNATWPNVGFDYDGRKRELTAGLVNGCPGVEFLPATVHTGEEAARLVKADGDKVDGFLVYALGIWNGSLRAAVASGKPTLLVDDLYGGSGEFLITYSSARREGRKVAAVSSSRFADVVEAARCFVRVRAAGGAEAFVAACDAARKRATPAPGDSACTPDKVAFAEPGEVLKRLRETTILQFGRPMGLAKPITDVFGTRIISLGFPELHAAYLKADKAEAERYADRWITAAARVVEPKRDEIVKSAQMHLGMTRLMKQYGAAAITVDCLGGFYSGQLHAYPCLGFTEMNNAGLVGACEADLMSTITMLTLTYLTGRPGYISDPVIDTSKNQIIYAHCVAPTKMFGPKGPTNPYHLRNHSEDRKGAVVRSLLPLGYMTSTMEFNAGRREVLFHQGRAVANVDEDKACRTKLAVDVKGDIDRLLTFWDHWGWHRVTVYGDVKPAVEEMARALKMRFVAEA